MSGTKRSFCKEKTKKKKRKEKTKNQDGFRFFSLKHQKQKECVLKILKKLLSSPTVIRYKERIDVSLVNSLRTFITYEFFSKSYCRIQATEIRGVRTQSKRGRRTLPWRREDARPSMAGVCGNLSRRERSHSRVPHFAHFSWINTSE